MPTVSYMRRSGFYALTFRFSTDLKYTKKPQTKHLLRYGLYTLLPAVFYPNFTLVIVSEPPIGVSLNMVVLSFLAFKAKVYSKGR